MKHSILCPTLLAVPMTGNAADAVRTAPAMRTWIFSYRQTRRLIASAMLLAAGLPMVCPAEEYELYVWMGGNSGGWSSPFNWNIFAVPQPAEEGPLQLHFTVANDDIDADTLIFTTNDLPNDSRVDRILFHQQGGGPETVVNWQLDGNSLDVGDLLFECSRLEGLNVHLLPAGLTLSDHAHRSAIIARRSDGGSPYLRLSTNVVLKDEVTINRMLDEDGQLVQGTPMTVSFERPVSGPGSLAIADKAVVILGGENTFAGPVSVERGGTLIVTGNQGLGSLLAGTEVAGTLNFDADDTMTINEPIRIEGDPVKIAAALHCRGESVTLAGELTLRNRVGIGADSPLHITRLTPANGYTANLVLAGSSEITLGGNQSNDVGGTGSLIVDEVSVIMAKAAPAAAMGGRMAQVSGPTGKITWQASNQIQDTTKIVIKDGGTLDLGSATETQNGWILMDGGSTDPRNTINIGSSGALRLKTHGIEVLEDSRGLIAGNGSSGSLVAVDPDVVLKLNAGASLSITSDMKAEPGGSFVVEGSGMLSLAGTGICTAPIRSSSATIFASNASTLSQAPMTIDGTARLSGVGRTGNVNATMTSEVDPGIGLICGKLSCGSLSLASRLRIDINSGVVGPANDQIAIKGTVSLSSPTLLMKLARGFDPVPGTSFVILDNDGTDAVAGIFEEENDDGTRRSLTERSLVGGGRFRITYRGGTGNDVALIAVAQPSGVTRTWTGKGGKLWSSAINWSPFGVPQSGDALVFPATTTQRVSVNDLSNLSLQKVSFSKGTYILFNKSSYQLSGNAVALADGIEVATGTPAILWGLPLMLSGPQVFSTAAGTSLSLTASQIDTNGMALEFAVAGQSAIACNSPLTEGGGWQFEKTGTGKLTLGGASTTRGELHIAAGEVVVTHANALGRSGEGTTTVDAGAILTLAGSSLFINEPIHLYGLLRIADGAGSPILGVGGVLRCEIGAELRVGNIGVNQLALLSAIQGTQLRKSGPGRLVLAGTGARSLSGGLAVDDGTLALNAGNLPGAVTVGTGGATSGELELNAGANTIPHTLTVKLGSAVRINAAGITIGSLTLQDGAVTGSPWKLAGPLTVLPGNFESEIFADVELADGITDWTVADGPASVDLLVNANVIEPAGASTTLSTRGEGRIEFLKNNASSTVENSRPDVLEVTAGTAVWNGYTPTMRVLAAGGVFGGSHTVGHLTVSDRGAMAPGNPLGTSRVSFLGFNAGAKLVVDLKNLLPGIGYDQIITPGDGSEVSLAEALLEVSTDFNPPPFQVFRIINVQGTGHVTPFTDLPDDSVFRSGGRNFVINYDGFDGNDVTLTHVPAATGVTRVWDGGGADSNWSTPANWDGNTLPKSGDSLLFEATVPANRRTMTQNLPNMAAASITFSGNAAYTLTGAEPLTVLTGITDLHTGADTVIAVPLSLGDHVTVVAMGPGNLVIQDHVNLRANTLTASTGGGRVDFAGVIAGTGKVVVTGAGTGEVQFSGGAGNTFTGGLELQSGTARLMKSGAAHSVVSPVRVNGGTLLTADGSDQIEDTVMVTIQGGAFQPTVAETITKLQLIGGAVITGTSQLTLAGNLLVQAAADPATISGRLNLGAAARRWHVEDGPAAVDLSVPAEITGAAAAGLELSGGGVVNLSGARGHAGATTLLEGTLRSNGTHTGGAAYTVAAGQVFEGTGSISSSFHVSGTLSAGSGIGTLATGPLAFDLGSTLAVQIDTNSGTADRINVAGDVAISGVGLNLNLSDVGANAPLGFGTKLVLIDYTGVWDDFDIVYINENPTFDGSTFKLGANSFIVDYSDDSLGGTAMTLTVSSGEPEISVQHPEDTELADGSANVDFGSVVVGNPAVLRTFKIKNLGTRSLTGLLLRLDGPHANDFSVGLHPTAPVAAPSGETTFTVLFTPGGAGSRTAFLRITNNDGDESPFDIALSGVGLVPEIAVEQPVGTALEVGSANVEFGKSLVGTSSTPLIFTIRNTGLAGLTGLALSAAEGVNAADFAVGPLGTTSLAAGGSTTFAVTFTPSATGERSATLRLASNDSDENPFDIRLVGLGTSPEISVELPFNRFLTSGVSVIDYGRVGVGSSFEMEARIKNTGIEPLTLGTPVLAGTGADAFIISASSLPTTLAPAAATTFRLKFRPLVWGVCQVTLSIPTNDADENPFTVALTGLGAGFNGPLNLSSTAVDEAQPTGVGVGLLSIADAVPGLPLSFNLVSGTGATDNALFAIEGDELVTKVPLDFESQPTCSVRVSGTDSDGTSIIAVFTITVNDVRTEDADQDGLTEAEEEDIHGTSDANPDFDADGLSDSAEVAFGSDPKDATSKVAVSLIGAAVESGAEGGTLVGEFQLSTGSVAGVIFELVDGPGGTENRSFAIAGVNLHTAPELLTLSGSIASVRVRASKGIGQIEQILPIIILQGVPSTIVLPVPPPFREPQVADLGASAATDNVLTVLGAPGDGVSGPGKGVAKVFSNATGELLHVLKNPNPNQSSGFGRSVAIDGAYVVIGCLNSAEVYVYDLTSDTPEAPAFVLGTPSPENDEEFFGRAVAISGTRVVVGAYRDDVGLFSNTGSAFVYDLLGDTPTVPAFTLPNPSPTAHDEFGWAVAIDGDRVVVSSPSEDQGATNSGSVYVFNLTAAVPVEPISTLNNPSPDAADQFGVAVALAGERVVVGSAADDTTGLDKGRAYVFAVTGGLIATLENPLPALLGRFGKTVAISNTHLAVGADGSTGLRNDGSVVTYEFVSGIPTLQATLVNPNPEPQQHGTANFGAALSLRDSALVVGMPGDSAIVRSAGSAYGFDLQSPTPGEVINWLHHESPSIGDHFGGSVSMPHGGGVGLSGSRMVVAAPAGNARAHVYDFTMAQPTVPELTLGSPAEGTFHGPQGYANSVAIDGQRVVVASNDGFEEVFGGFSTWRYGVVYVHDLDSATPEVPTHKIETGPGFRAERLAISGTKLAVGGSNSVDFAQWLINFNAPPKGRVMLYDLANATPTVPVATLFSPDGFPDPRFGTSVALSGTTLVVSDSSAGPSAGESHGRVYVYDWSGPTPILTHTILNPNPRSGSFAAFGESVAVAGTRVLVAAHQHYFDATNTNGVVYLYDLASPTPTVPVLTLVSPDSFDTSVFGWALAMEGDRAMISELRNINSGGLSPANVGRAYIYNLAGPSPATPAFALTNPQPNSLAGGSGDLFGASVALSGSLAAIGVPQSNIEAAGKGYVWLFGPAPGNSAPVITLIGESPVMIEAGMAYTDAGATAVDAQDGPVATLMTGNTVVPTVAGVYEVTYSATDSSGLTATASRIVEVIPSQPPTLTAPAAGFQPLSVQEGTGLPDYRTQALAADNSGVVTVTQSIAPGTLLGQGTVTITLTATDGVGNQTSISLEVIVAPAPSEGIFSDDWPLTPQAMEWHNDFIQHPINGWFYGTCQSGGLFGDGMIFRINAAGEYQALVHFIESGTVSNGKAPAGRLILGTDGNFYGTTTRGGTNNGNGTVFKMTPAGELTTLVSFTGSFGSRPGSFPSGGVVEGPDGSFFGTTANGGALGRGTLFKVTADGTFTSLLEFTGNGSSNKGSQPSGGLVLGPDGMFYGMTAQGGVFNCGTIFKVSPSGALTTLVEFTGDGTTDRGSEPYGGLTLSTDGSFYGMTSEGGEGNCGTVFKMTPEGSLTTLVEFSYDGPSNTGGYPYGDLVLAPDGRFYGMTSEGAAHGVGTVFKMTSTGTLTTLVEFTYDGAINGGGYPYGSLAIGSDGNLYGTTSEGGSFENGTVFRITPQGGLTSLIESTDKTDGATDKGAYPHGGLITGPDGLLYGTTANGGTMDRGTIFRLSSSGVRTTLLSFTENELPNKGANPQAGLTVGPDGNLYGVTQSGGIGYGTVFRMTTDGALTTLVEFTFHGDSNRGAHPIGALALGADGQFYGATRSGGSDALGTLFRVSTAGLLTTLVEFSGNGPVNPGLAPEGGLILAPDGNLYGTTYAGGEHGNGTIFKLTASGVLTTLVHLDGANGARPLGTLALGPDGQLYGMTSEGGAQGYGTVFKVSTNGVFAKLIDFDGAEGTHLGAWPSGSLTLAPDGFLYGMTDYGGSRDLGTLFKMTPDGVLTTLAEFLGSGSGIERGSTPLHSAFLNGADGQLYGMTTSGGRQGGGAVFRIAMPATNPVIEVRGNGVGIVNNDSTPSADDNTSFGVVASGSGSTVRLFTIHNTGAGPLTISSAGIIGEDASDFSVTTAPASPLPAGGSTTFGITFSPAEAGAKSAQVSLDTNDNGANPFRFQISGTGNSAPQFTGHSLSLVSGESVLLQEVTVLGLATDTDGQTLEIADVDGFSAQGVAITREGGAISYRAPTGFSGADSFSVSISDGIVSKSGVITVQVFADAGITAAKTLRLTPAPGQGMSLAFAGRPGLTYSIQRSIDLITWAQIATATSGADGTIQYLDASSPPDGAFYRISYPSQ